MDIDTNENLSPSNPLRRPRQVVVTVVWGNHLEILGDAFTSFAQNSSLELHAYIYGGKLPEKRFPEVNYHLVEHDPDYTTVRRDALYRRWLFPDDLNADYALVIDANDVLCMQRLPEIPDLLRGASVAGCTEYRSSRELAGQGYTSAYLNAGVTFWHVPSTKEIRQAICARGRSLFRTPFDDQLALNEVLHTCYYDRLLILPCQYNYRGYVGRKQRGWPTVEHLDGVMIYHNCFCIEAAKKLIPVKPKAELPPLAPDRERAGLWKQFWRRWRYGIKMGV